MLKSSGIFLSNYFMYIYCLYIKNYYLCHIQTNKNYKDERKRNNKKQSNR